MFPSHHVGIHGLTRARQNLDRLVRARGRDDRVRARNRRNDVFHHSERELVRDAGDAVRLGPLLGLLAYPLRSRRDTGQRGGAG